MVKKNNLEEKMSELKKDAVKLRELGKDIAQDSQLQGKVNFLKTACEDYKKHFRTQYKNYDGMLKVFNSFDNPKDRDSNLDFLKTIEGSTNPTDLAVAKYAALCDLLQSLEQVQEREKAETFDDLKKPTLQRSIKYNADAIAGFDEKYKKYHELFEKRRDTAADKFLKVVATVLTLGVAAALGIWNVHGKEKFTSKIDQYDADQAKESRNKR